MTQGHKWRLEKITEWRASWFVLLTISIWWSYQREWDGQCMWHVWERI